MYLGTDWTATTSGAVTKFVRCEQCGRDYAYVMERTIRASSFTPLGLNNAGAADRSRAEAERRLRRSLQDSCDPVPCPACGWYQAAMVRRVRQKRLGWVQQVGIALVPLSLFFALFSGLYAFKALPKDEQMRAGLIVGLATLLLSPVLLVGRYLLNRYHDPNRRPAEARIALGKRLALTRREYETVLAERNRAR